MLINTLFIAALIIWLSSIAVITIGKADNMDKLIWAVFSMIIGISLGLLVYFILAPLAYMERGYFAIGGEGLLAFIIAWFTGPMLIWKRDEIIARHRKLSRRARDRKSIERLRVRNTVRNFNLK